MTGWGFWAEFLTTAIWAGVIVWAVCWLYPGFVRDVLPRLRRFEGFGVKAELSEEKLEAAAKSRKTPLSFDQRHRLDRRLALAGAVVERARILWVDDIPENNTLETGMLEALGARVTAVKTSAAAEKRLRDEPFDLVLSDMGREGSSSEGADFAARLAGRDPGLPVIIYTGVDQTGMPRPAHVFGITNRPDELLHLVLDALERRRL